MFWVRQVEISMLSTETSCFTYTLDFYRFIETLNRDGTSPMEVLFKIVPINRHISYRNSLPEVYSVSSLVNAHVSMRLLSGSLV